jgi:hypothetical protein
VTWAVVLYPAWDRWSDTDADVRAAVYAWLESWIADGPPPDAHQVDRLVGTVGTDLRYFPATHTSTGVTVDYIIGRTGAQDFVALLDLRSPRHHR